MKKYASVTGEDISRRTSSLIIQRVANCFTSMPKDFPSPLPTGRGASQLHRHTLINKLYSVVVGWKPECRPSEP